MIDKFSKLKELTAILNNCAIEGQKIIDINHDITGSSTNWLDFLMLNLLDRFVSTSKSVSLLIPQYLNEPVIENSIGILLRTSLYDSCLVIYLSHVEQQCKNQNDKNRLFQVVRSILLENVLHSRNFLNNLNSTKFINQIDFERLIGIIEQRSIEVPRYYDGSLKILSITVPQMLKEISSVNNEINKFKIREAYEMWYLYSKYEHFGFLTYELQRQKEEIIVSNIMTSIIIVLENMSSVVQSLKVLLRVDISKFESIFSKEQKK